MCPSSAVRHQRALGSYSLRLENVLKQHLFAVACTWVISLDKSAPGFQPVATTSVVDNIVTFTLDEILHQ
eukprot:9506888-Karenia_brevis.AAC.1